MKSILPHMKKIESKKCIGEKVGRESRERKYGREVWTKKYGVRKY